MHRMPIRTRALQCVAELLATRCNTLQHASCVYAHKTKDAYTHAGARDFSGIVFGKYKGAKVCVHEHSIE